MLNSTEAVIQTLGGINAVARLTGRTHDAVWLWKKNGRFPSHTYLLLNEALAAKKHRAPQSLWSMTRKAAS